MGDYVAKGGATGKRADSPGPLEAAAAATAQALKNIAGVGIDQHGKAVAERQMFGVHHDGSFAFDAPAEYAADAQQRAAAANFTGVSTTVTDDLAVGAQDCFHQGNRAQSRLPFATFIHTKTCVYATCAGTGEIVPNCGGSGRVNGNQEVQMSFEVGT